LSRAAPCRLRVTPGVAAACQIEIVDRQVRLQQGAGQLPLATCELSVLLRRNDHGCGLAVHSDHLRLAGGSLLDELAEIALGFLQLPRASHHDRPSVHFGQTGQSVPAGCHSGL